MDIICENQPENGKNLYSANRRLNESCHNEISALTTPENEVDFALGCVMILHSPCRLLQIITQPSAKSPPFSLVVGAKIFQLKTTYQVDTVNYKFTV